MEKWFVANKLSLNIDKTCYIVFGCIDKCQTDISLNLFINGQRINKVSSCKYLGVVIDDAFKWEEHVDYIYIKIIRFTSIFYKMRVIVPNKILKKLYFAFIHPHIAYGIEVYANSSKACLDKLVKANNKILRVLMNKNFETPNIDLYRSFNVLSIPLLHEMSLLQLIFKFHYFNHLLPEIFKDYYSVNSSIHDHSTRSKSDLHLVTVRSNYGKRCSEFRAGQFWNSLPNNLKKISSCSLFKSSIKHFLLNRSE